MEAMENILTRRSVRVYEDQPVSRETLDTVCLAAWAKGLGTCIMGIYDEDKVPALLEVPEDQYVTAIVSMGYPAETPKAPKRKPLEEKVQYV